MGIELNPFHGSLAMTFSQFVTDAVTSLNVRYISNLESRVTV
jgi:hypothetical protein